MRSKFLMALLSLLLIGSMAGTIFLQIYQTDAQNKKLQQEQQDQLASFNSSLSAASSQNAANRDKYLKIEDLVEGNGAEVQQGDTVTVKYRGTLEDGTVFDETIDTPFSTPVGVGRVIQGWDEGIVGMKVGGKRKLTIQPEWGYGAQAQGKIPANSVLIFEVELLDTVSSTQNLQVK